MKNAIILLICCLPILAMAQDEQGIHFEQGLSWKQIKEKAKAENKFIFVDCYATWCGPCKAMDSLVYPSNEVANKYNKRFVAVKVQMDKTSHDDPQTMKWYKDADAIQAMYAINAFPSFLFFSPDGNPVHKVIGFQSKSRFIALAEDAQNPQKQFYTIAKNFQPGKLDTAEMKSLVTLFLPIDKVLAGKIAADYLNRVPGSELDNTANLAFMAQHAYLPEVREVALRYTSTLPEKKLYTKGRIELVSEITKSTSDPGFFLFFQHPDKIDEIVNQKGFGQRTADHIIYTTEISPILQSAAKDTIIHKVAEAPDFAAMATSIEKKYNKGCAERNILTAKIKWYEYMTKKYKTNWPEYALYFTEQVEKDGIDSTINKWNVYMLNNEFWNIILKHSTDDHQLKIAIACMEKVAKMKITDQSNHMDTYANLLYKAGRKEEAIAIESLACDLSPKFKPFQKNLEKMKNNEPTWLDK
ncbi:MAG: thioredoxin domain-containing protein [Bacteroidota bacterium]